MTLPVAASLTVDGQPALYSGAAGVGRLALANTSGQTLTLAPAAGPASRSNHQVALHLPAGTLSVGSRRSLTVADGWRFAVEPSGRGRNLWDSLFLLRPAGAELADGAELVALVHGLAADPAGSSRRTRVTVDYAFTAADGTVVAGSRNPSLTVVPWPHAGADLRLHVGVLHGHAVVNGAEVGNRVVIALTSTAVGGAVTFHGGQTRLELSWPVGAPDTSWWSLCTPSQAEHATVLVDWNGGRSPRRVDPALESQPTMSASHANWTVVVPHDIELAFGHSIHIELDELVTEHPTGPVDVDVKVLGVGGGSSGHFALPLHKQPAAFRPVPAGSARPGAVEVFGEVALSGALRIGRGPALRLERYESTAAAVETGVPSDDWEAILTWSTSAEVGLLRTSTWLLRREAGGIGGTIERGLNIHPRWQAQVLFVRRELLDRP